MNHKKELLRSLWVLLGPKHLLRTYSNGTWTLWGSPGKRRRSDERLAPRAEEPAEETWGIPQAFWGLGFRVSRA